MAVNSRTLADVSIGLSKDSVQPETRRAWLDVATQVDTLESTQPDLSTYETSTQTASRVAVVANNLADNYYTGGVIDNKDTAVRNDIAANYPTNAALLDAHYTKTEVDTRISGAGNFDPILTQADWSEGDNQAAGYVRNKPTASNIAQQALASSTNLNTITQPGNYTFTASAPNRPFDNAGALRVYLTRVGSNNHIVQDARRDSDTIPHSYHRYTSNGGSTWGLWREHDTGEVNVTPDWDITNSATPGYIAHKPNIPTTLVGGVGIDVVGNEIRGETATTTNAGIVELATNNEGATGTSSSVALTPAAMVARTSTTTRSGLIETATVSEATQGTATNRAVTPQGLRAATNALNLGDANVQSNWNAASGDAHILNKPTLAPSNAEQNVQSNWNATSGDALILNKPNLPASYAPTNAEANVGVEYSQAEKTKLSGVATGAEVNVQSNWNATSGDALILNKPVIPTVPPALTPGDGIDIVSNQIRIETATTSNRGGVELATSAETIDGTDTTRAVTPADISAKLVRLTQAQYDALTPNANVIYFITG